MKSVRLYSPGDLRLQDEAIPIPGNDQQLVHVKAVGICGSDLHWFTEAGIGDARLEKPLVLGHEFSGETEDGRRVAVDPAIPCGYCEFCQQGDPNLCSNLLFAGHGRQDGALREYLVWRKNLFYQLPDSITDAEGAMLEPLGVAIHTVDLGKIRTGMTVGVHGCGTIGLLVVQMARLSGATNIIATDILVHRVEAAESLGAHHAFLACQESATDDKTEVDSIMAASAGRGVDVAFEVAGDQQAVDVAFATVIPGGTVVLAGIPATDKTSFSASTARRKGLTIKLVRRMKRTYPRALDLVTKGLVDVRSLVTHHFPLSQAEEAFRVATRRDGLKVIIDI
jgi:L-iditol 2-dehydrogenase